MEKYVRVVYVEEKCFSSTEKSSASAILDENLIKFDENLDFVLGCRS